MEKSLGRTFHIETMGAVDGPGLRLVLFLQGCPLRCPYCHNPEGWPAEGGTAITVEEVLKKYDRYRTYYKEGGITLSGGEPLLQAAFARELFAACKKEGIHTALDTSGCVESPEALAACEEADLLLLDIKHSDPAVHEERFGFPLSMPLGILTHREEKRLPVWVRHVVVPGLTDAIEEIDGLATLLAPCSCIKKVELLPFRKLCLEKYAQLNLPFPLSDTAEADEEAVQALSDRLQSTLPL